MKIISDKQEQKIIEKFIGGNPVASVKPILYTMAGIPASGKTTFLSMQGKKGNLPQNYYYHDPDKVMELLEGYKDDFATLGAKSAKSLWELPARRLADNILFPLAIEHRLNIVMDMGLCRTEIIEMIQSCRAEGYIIKMQFIYCDLPVAIQRSRKRERYMSAQEIHHRASFLASNMSSILSIADSLQIWDNSDLESPYSPLSAEQAKVRLTQNYGLCSTG